MKCFKFSRLLLLLPYVVANELSLLKSSLFELKLIPTERPLESTAAVKLQIAMRSSLFQATSVTSTFDDIFDIDVVLNRMRWLEEDETTSAQFQMHVTFYDNESTAPAAAQPTRYSLDTVIARTFSQPSTKAGFIIQLGLLRDPDLSLVEDVSIELVLGNEEESTSVGRFDSDERNSLSTLDIVLITASSAIFLGVLCVVYGQHRARERFEESFLDLDTRKIRGSKSREDEFGQYGRDEGNIQEVPVADVTASIDSDGHVSNEEEQNGTPAANSTNLVEDAKEKRGGTKKESQVKATSHGGGDSPPVSPSPSVPSSSSEVSPTTRCSSTPSSPVPSSHTTAYLLGVSTPSAKETSMEHSPLTARLLNLPSLIPGSQSNDKKSSRSFASAPTKLGVTSASSVGSTPSREGARSVRSARTIRSLRSIRSATGLYDVVEYPSLETSSTRSSGNKTDLAVISEQNLLAASREFENDWKISEKMAEDDDEVNSNEDVFHVDVDQHSSVEESQSRMSGLSAVSEWLHSIRVVGSSVDSRTSEISKSSAEHSSVEPSSMQGRVVDASDHSLEQSLATSQIDI